MNRKKNRLVAFLAGIVVCLLAMELILRVIGAIYAYRSESDEVIKDPAQCTILCVGDSVTFGLGAPRIQSYPAQLQRLLNTGTPQKKINVINRGRPGYNTTLLLETLSYDIREAKPDIVLILTGGANSWNFLGYRVYRQQNKFLSFMSDQLYKVHLYKLIKLLLRNIRYRNRDSVQNKHDSIRAIEPPRETIDLSAESIIAARKSKAPKVYCLIGEAYMKKGDYDQALNWFHEGINVDPTFPMSYNFIGRVYREQKQFNKALYWFKKGLEATPTDALDHHAYGMVATGFFNLGLYDEAIEFFKKEESRHPAAKDFLLMYGEGDKKKVQKRVKEWLRDDFGKILSICEKHKATTLIQNYPNYWDKELNDLIDDVLLDLSNQYDFYFVNHYRVFRQLKEKGDTYKKHFVPDGHPNKNGYGVMAANVFKMLKEERLY